MTIDFTALFIVLMVIVLITALFISVVSYFIFNAIKNLATKVHNNGNYTSFCGADPMPNAV